MTSTGQKPALAPEQIAFVEKRRNLVRLWRWTGLGLLLLVLGFTIYLAIRTPLLINPFETISRLESGTLPESTLVIMAAMLPVMFSAALILLLALVAVMYAAIGNEKKYLAMIDGLTSSDD